MGKRISRRAMLKATGAAAGAATVLGATGGVTSAAEALLRSPRALAATDAGLSGRIVRPADGTEACMTWIGEFREAMLDHVEGGYVNVPDRAIAEFGTSYYGTNFARLRSIKRRWDPAEVFHFEQSIPPA